MDKLMSMEKFLDHSDPIDQLSEAVITETFSLYAVYDRKNLTNFIELRLALSIPMLRFKQKFFITEN
jgi:hypothetical protein